MPKGVYLRSPETLEMITQRVKEARKKRSYHPRTQEERAAISIGTRKALEGKPAWNKNLTKDSDARVAKYSDSRKGRKLTDEQKKKISDTVKANPPRYWLGKHRSPETIQKLRDARARQKALPKQGTHPENLIEAELKNKDILYIAHFCLPEISKRSEADFFLFELGSILLFVDGDYTHANPQLFDAKHVMWKDYKGIDVTAEQVWKRDASITNKLKDMGYTVIRIWEKDILENPSKTLDTALKLLNLVNSLRTALKS